MHAKVPDRHGRIGIFLFLFVSSYYLTPADAHTVSDTPSPMRDGNLSQLHIKLTDHLDHTLSEWKVANLTGHHTG